MSGINSHLNPYNTRSSVPNHLHRTHSSLLLSPQTKSAAPEGAAPFNSGSWIDQPVKAGATGSAAGAVVDVVADVVGVTVPRVTCIC
ncbi:unannotated protein [freshwater metagenome]|uniref:Unannotated protein n=1 Tax=freshwater metagenome TaxID=449393 RepID=A0A6J6PC49_9ZZZZ